MKRLWRFFGVIAFGMIFCAGCGNGQTDIISSEYSGEPVEISSEYSEKPDEIGEDGQSVSIKENYRSILLNNGRFICTDLKNQELNIGEIKEAITDDDSITAAVTKFAVVDLSGDGENEIVLWIQINSVSDYGFEILRYQEDAVYGYTLPYRVFMDLKTDGTFMFSGGAADSGIGKLRFSEDGYTVDQVYYSESEYDSENELIVQYFANGETCSEEEFNDAVRRQEEKQNIGWYDLTADDVNIAFENEF